MRKKNLSHSTTRRKIRPGKFARTDEQKKRREYRVNIFVMFFSFFFSFPPFSLVLASARARFLGLFSSSTDSSLFASPSAYHHSRSPALFSSSSSFLTDTRALTQQRRHISELVIVRRTRDREPMMMMMAVVVVVKYLQEQATEQTCVGVHTRRKQHSEEFSQCECLLEEKKTTEKQEILEYC